MILTYIDGVALVADSGNPVALKNLGAIFGKEEGSLRALYYLRRSNECDPQDPQTVYGLAFAYMELGDMEPAQKHFQKVLETEAPEELRSLARDGPRRIAVSGLKAREREAKALGYHGAED
jgi:tetratricopeptide (TPR) repeat protein